MKSLIVAAALLLAACSSSQAPRYAVTNVSPDGFFVRLDTQTGEMWECGPGRPACTLAPLPGH